LPIHQPPLFLTSSSAVFSTAAGWLLGEEFPDLATFEPASVEPLPPKPKVATPAPAQ